MTSRPPPPLLGRLALILGPPSKAQEVGADETQVGALAVLGGLLFDCG